MRKLGNLEMGKGENERMRKLANEEGATRKASVEGLLVYSTLPKVRGAQAVVARRAINFGKV